MVRASLALVRLASVAIAREVVRLVTRAAAAGQVARVIVQVLKVVARVGTHAVVGRLQLIVTHFHISRVIQTRGLNVAAGHPAAHLLQVKELFSCIAFICT